MGEKMSNSLYVLVRIEDGEIRVEHFDRLEYAQQYILDEYFAIYNSDFHSKYVRKNISDDRMSAYYDRYYFNGRSMDVNAIQWKIFIIDLDAE